MIWKKCLSLSGLCKIVKAQQFQNFTFQCCLFTQNIFFVPLKQPHNFFLKPFVKPATVGYLFFEFFKAEDEEILHQFFCLDKKTFCLFLEHKKIQKKILFIIFLLAIVLWCIRMVSAKIPMISWKLKLCRAYDARVRSRICRFYRKNIPDLPKCVAFQKLQKC